MPVELLRLRVGRQVLRGAALAFGAALSTSLLVLEVPDRVEQREDRD